MATFTFAVEPDLKVIIVTGTGALDRADVTSLRGATIPPGFGIVVDLREVVAGDISTDDIRAIALDSPRPDAPHRLAIVTGPSDAAYGVGRVVAGYRDRDDSEVRVFREFEPALAWTASRGAGPA